MAAETHTEHWQTCKSGSPLGPFRRGRQVYGIHTKPPMMKQVSVSSKISVVILIQQGQFLTEESLALRPPLQAPRSRHWVRNGVAPGGKRLVDGLPDGQALPIRPWASVCVPWVTRAPRRATANSRRCPGRRYCSLGVPSPASRLPEALTIISFVYPCSPHPWTTTSPTGCTGISC